MVAILSSCAAEPSPEDYRPPDTGHCYGVALSGSEEILCLSYAFGMYGWPRSLIALDWTTGAELWNRGIARGTRTGPTGLKASLGCDLIAVETRAAPGVPMEDRGADHCFVSLDAVEDRESVGWRMRVRRARDGTVVSESPVDARLSWPIRLVPNGTFSWFVVEPRPVGAILRCTVSPCWDLCSELLRQSLPTGLAPYYLMAQGSLRDELLCLSWDIEGVIWRIQTRGPYAEWSARYRLPDLGRFPSMLWMDGASVHVALGAPGVGIPVYPVYDWHWDAAWDEWQSNGIITKNPVWVKYVDVRNGDRVEVLGGTVSRCTSAGRTVWTTLVREPVLNDSAGPVWK